MARRKGSSECVVGVGGCGAMGLPMARRLLAAGFGVVGHDVRPIEEFGDFAAHMCVDPREFAARADVVLSVVRDVRETNALCFHEQALFAHEDAPQMLVVCSTLSPAQVRALATRLPPGTRLVDAPMSGAPIAAEHGTLTFMVGGDGEDVTFVTPLLAAMGSRIVHVGPCAAGMTAKVLNNYVAGASVVAVRRVLEAARRLGVDRDLLRARVMAHSSGSTWYGDNLEAIAWAREGYSPRNTIGIVEKDVRCALDAFDEADLAPSALDETILAALRDLEPYE